MSEPSGRTQGEAASAPRTEARLEKSRWPGWVWAAPGVALLVVAYLVVQALAHPGVSVEVLFDTAAGVQPGQTRVAYHGLEVGVVKGVELAPDGRRIRMKLFLHPDARPLLHAGTVFWIVGAKPSITDIASLKSIFAGSSLEMEVGPGPPARRFTGLDKPPDVPPGVAGKRFVLTGPDLGPVQEGSIVTFHGLAAGKVLSRALDGGSRVRAEVFVAAPYDAQVTPGSRFWIDQPVRVSGGAQGLAAQVSPAALIAGGVAFDTPAQASGEPASAAGRVFPLYTDKDQAEAAPGGAEVAYRLAFDGDVGTLKTGSAVRLRGFVVGRVVQVELAFDPASGRLTTPVVIGLDPQRLHLGGPGELDAGLARLVGQGLRARLKRDPPLVGASEVRLELAADARGAPVVRQGGRVVIPTARSSDLDALSTQAGQVLATVNAMPLLRIGENLREVSGRLRVLTASPKLEDSLDHLDRALDNVDAITTTARPEVRPLIASLRAAADRVQAAAGAGQALLSGEGAAQDSDLPSAIRQLNDAARSVRAFADYLDRHPEALIRGKRP